MSNRDDDLRDELRSHLDMATADRVSRGEPPREAAAHARELGNVGQIQEAARDVWGGRWILHALQDVRYARRVFRRNPGFAIVAILSLTLGIGATCALRGDRRRPAAAAAHRRSRRPLRDPARVDGGLARQFRVVVSDRPRPIWRELSARQQAFLAVRVVERRRRLRSVRGGETRRINGIWVTGGFFDTLGLHPARGRLLTPADDQRGCAPRAVLGLGFWQRAYGGDPAIAGRMLTVRGRQIEIVGVAPAAFHGLEVGRSFDVALPLCAEAVLSADGKGRADSGTTWWLSVFGRLKPGWTIDRATSHLAAISPDMFKTLLPAGYPATSVEKYLAMTMTAVPGGKGLSQLRERASPLWLLLAIASLVLLIACTNLANLLLARASARGREIAVRLRTRRLARTRHPAAADRKPAAGGDRHRVGRAARRHARAMARRGARNDRHAHHAAAGGRLARARLRGAARRRHVSAVRSRARAARHARHGVVRAARDHARRVGRPTDRRAPPRARRGADRAVGRAPLWLAVVRAYYATC